MTRKLNPHNPVLPASGSQQPNNSGLDCGSLEVTNSKSRTSGNIFPPTFHRQVDPSSDAGLEIRACHDSVLSAPIEGSDILNCQNCAPPLRSEDSDPLGSVEQSSTQRSAVTDRGSHDFTCNYPSRLDSAKGQPITFELPQHVHGNERSRSCLQHPKWVATLSKWSCSPLNMPTSVLRHHVIPAAHGFALTLKPGAHLRIVDLHGQQVVDFMAWAMPFQSDNSCEHFSASYTRYRLGGSAPPQIGECLYSNADRAMFEILEDKVKCHDMLFMACNPSFYARLGQSEHRSCASNMAEAMAKRGFELVQGKGEQGWSGVHDPFNVFQNTPYYSLKALECSRKGDWIEMKVCEEMEQGVVVALSSCPYEDKGFNGGKATDVGVVWEEL